MSYQDETKRNKSIVQALPVVKNEQDGADLRLGDIPLRQEVELVSIDLPAHLAEPLLERGVLPGCRICPVRSSPGGDPIVSVDGSLLALRRETAACLCVKILSQFQDAD
jgi:Fe2+ transport system protein FeoA